MVFREYCYYFLIPIDYFLLIYINIIRHFFDQIIPFKNSNLTVTTELSYVSGLGNSRTTQYENINRKVTRDVTPKNTPKNEFNGTFFSYKKKQCTPVNPHRVVRS